MKIINVDLLDGKPLIPIAVNDDDAARLANFISDARDLFSQEKELQIAE